MKNLYDSLNPAFSGWLPLLVFFFLSPFMIGELQAQSPYLWLYGDQAANMTGRTKAYNNAVYNIGKRGEAATDPATFTKYDALGNTVWQVQLPPGTVLSDFTSYGDNIFMLVGRTLPSSLNVDNQSILCQIRDNGATATVVFIRYFYQNGREGFNRITTGPSTILTQSYIISGIEIASGSLDMINLYRVDQLGNLVSKVSYNDYDDQYASGLIYDFANNLTLLGQLVPSAVTSNAFANYVTVDQNFNLVEAVRYNARAYFHDAMINTLTGVKIVVGENENGNGFLSEIVPGGNVNWSLEMPGNSRLYRIVGPVETDFFVLGTAIVAGQTRTIVHRFRYNQSTGAVPFLVWSRYLDEGEINFQSGYLELTSNYNLLYTDSRENNPDGFALKDKLIGVFDLNLASCMTYDLQYELTAYPMEPVPMEIPYIERQLPQYEQLEQTQPTYLTQVDPCGDNPCDPDNTPPVFTACPADMTVTVTCENFVDVPFQTAATDDCGPVTITCVPASGSAFSLGTTTVVCTATDLAGNTATCTFDVTVISAATFNVVCPLGGISIPLDANCEAVVPDMTGWVQVQSDCPYGVTQTPVAGTILTGQGLTNVTVTVTSSTGQTATCIIPINAVDTTPPVITCPTDITVTSTLTAGGANVTFPDPVVTDNCGATWVCSSISGDFFNCNTSTLVTCIATDVGGRTDTCDFAITVLCDQPCDLDVICPPGGISIPLDNNCEASVPDMTTWPQVFTNCNYNVTQIPAAGTIITGQGVTNVVITITTSDGQTFTCTVPVNTVDTTPPVITCPADITVTSTLTAGGAFVTFPDPVVTDNCGATWVCSSISGDFFNCNTSTLVTCIATDIGGRTDTCDFAITVLCDQPCDLDVICPPGGISIPLDNNCEASVPDMTTWPQVFTNCNYNVTQIPAAGTIITGQGVTNVVITITTSDGQTFTCTVPVNTVDTTPPVITCPADITVTSTLTAGGAFVTFPDPVVTDNCGATWVCSSISGDFFNCNTSTLVTCIATDIGGRTDTCDFAITVLCDQPCDLDVICPPGGISIPLDDNCEARVPDMTTWPQVFTNCIYNVTQVPAAGTIIAGQGVTNVVITITTSDGQTFICTVPVNTVDTTPPVITCPTDITVTSTLTAGGANVTFPDPVVTDNCGATWVCSSISGDFFDCNTSTLVTCIATDIGGRTDTCDFAITVLCDQPCDLDVICPADGISVLLDDKCEAIVPDLTGGLQVFTNCNYTVNQVPAAGTIIAGPGITNVIITVTTSDGQVFTCTVIINAVDNTPPTIICPNDITLNGTVAAGGAISVFTDPVVNDNCGATWVCSHAPGDLFPCDQSTLVTCTATDFSGNTAACQFSITVLCPQDSLQFSCGMAVTTCYADPVVGGGPVAAVFDVRNNASAPVGQDWHDLSLGAGIVPAIHPPNWDINTLGQIFGTAIDRTSGDIYFSATDVYRLDAVWLSNVVGPAGSGGIYRTPGTNLNVTNTFVGTTGIPSTPCALIGNNQIPNTGTNVGNSLGNIAYDKYNDQLFATNLEDGRIYRIDINTGNILSIYDPFATGADTPGIVPFGEGLWGIGLLEEAGVVKVYFARETSATTPGELWSVNLTGTGEFAATINAQCIHSGAETLHLTFPAGGQTKVTDLAFSEACKMLISERGHPHQAHVYEYNLIAGNWTFAKEYFIGGGSASTNSAGGVDYGYVEDNGDILAGCDSLVWATGNYMWSAVNGCCLYGMQGIIQPCNAPGGNASTDLFIDYDSDYVSQQKWEIGDVEIFRCIDCEKPEDFCDSLMVMAEPINQSPDLCCYDVDLKNNYGPSITKVEAEILTPDWIFNTGSLNLGGGFIWGAPPTSTNLCIRNNGGAIPNGMSLSALQFCLEEVVATAGAPQQIVFRWYQQLGPNCEEVVCTDTIITNCQPPNPHEGCVAIVEHSIVCSPDNPLEYCMTFKVQNQTNSSINLDAYQVIMHSLTAPGTGFHGCTGSTTIVPIISIDTDPLPLVPGAISNDLCVKIAVGSPITSPTSVCFNFGLNLLSACCHEPQPYCVVLEPCCDPCESISVIAEPAVPVVDPTGADRDECCYNLDIQNECEYEYFTKVSVEILTPGVIFGYHAIGGAHVGNWSMCGSSLTQLCLEPNSGFVPAGFTDDLLTFCLSGLTDQTQVPQQLVVNFYCIDPLTGQEVICCEKLIETECTPPVSYDCLEISDERISCEVDENGNPKYVFTFTVTNHSPGLSADYLSAFLSAPAGLMFDPSGIFPLVPPLNFNESRTITTCITGAIPPPSYDLIVNFRLSNLPGDTCCYENLFDTIPLPTCFPTECVPGDHTIDGSVFTDNNYHVDGHIYSDAIVDQAAVVEYVSSVEIDLLPGFEVVLGAEFHAYIAPCVAEGLSSETLDIEIVNLQRTTIELLFHAKADQDIRLELLDHRGKVKTTREGPIQKGSQSVLLLPDNLEKGVYYLQVKTGDELLIDKIVIE